MNSLNQQLQASLFILAILFCACNNPNKQDAKSLTAEDTLLLIRSYNDSGLALAKNDKDYHMAIVYFSKALDIKPDYDVAYSNRANAYRLLKEYDKAIADFNHAIEINPTDTILHFLKARVYEDSKNYKNAVKELDIFLLMKSKDSVLLAKAYLKRGNAYESLGKNKLAENDFQKAKLLGYK